jgi:hypothetical protein
VSDTPRTVAVTDQNKLPRKCIHKAKVSIVVNGKWGERIDERHVILLAIAGKWAMVKFPRAMPYVAPLREIVDE